MSGSKGDLSRLAVQEGTVSIRDWNHMPEEAVIEKTVKALSDRGVEVFVAGSGEEARKKVLEIIPQGAEVVNVTSMTLETIGVSKDIAESGRFNSMRKKLSSMDRKTQGAEMRRIGAAPDWVVGSVHAVTEDGQVLVASRSGSQLPGYAYGAGQVLWVVGVQKIVRDLEDGLRRIREHSFPLEDARARKAYGIPSGINKILIFERESVPNRVKLIFVRESLGF